MKRDRHCWHSPALGRDMELLTFGHAGARVLAFPPSMGRCTDWEEHGLVAALGPALEQGDYQLYCVETVDTESWYSNRPPRERVRRQAEYDRYLTDEVLPRTREANPDPFLIVAGVSFGGYHALNFALRHPEAVRRLLCMSGMCDIRPFADGYYDDEVYYNNPCDFIANEHDPARLAALRRLDIILAVGRDDTLYTSNERLSQLLWGKGIWHALRVWNGVAHDWPAWEKMLPMYVGGHD